MKDFIVISIMVFFYSWMIAPYLLKLYDRIRGTHKLCDTFGWHNGKGQTKGVSFDGCSIHAKCSKCNKEVMQDGQGNWF